MRDFDIVIVGAGHGGAQAAITLRQEGFDGSIAIVGDEPYPPYERPPLTKGYLAGTKPFERMLIRPDRFWTERAITLELGRKVVRVDARSGHIELAGGEAIQCGKLIWAAGGSARRLGCEGDALAGVHVIRTRADADAILESLPHVRRAVVIGAGFVGLESAAMLATAGKQVSLIETAGRVLARVAAEPVSRFYEAEHRARGIDVRLDTQVTRIIGNGRVEAVETADGMRLAADLVVVGIGIDPAVGPLIDAGAEGGNGVRVDRACRASLPNVYAIGDCALHPSLFAAGEFVRIESVQNAVDQAKVAASHVLGRPAIYDALPWFWSDQFDLKMQTAGLILGHDEVIVRGDPAQRSFSVIYRRDGRMIAIDAINAARDFVQAKALLPANIRVDAAILADVSLPLKALLDGSATGEGQASRRSSQDMMNE